MKFRSLQTQFLLAGCLLVLTTVACGVWSVILIARLSYVVGETLRRSQETIELTAQLAGALEREDDALGEALAGNVRNARSNAAQQRQDFDDAYALLLPRLRNTDAEPAARDLREHADAYRKVGNELLDRAGQPGANHFYHKEVNPALRKAVEDCSSIRRWNSQLMQQVRDQARIETTKAMGIMAGIALVALGLSTLVMLRLAHVILRPVYELTRSVEAIRREDFKSRVKVESEDELGQLAEGFNRMAEKLGDYRESSLGELLSAKWTLDATLAALPDAVIVVDPDGVVVEKNPLAKRILDALASGGVHPRRDQPGSTPVVETGPERIERIEELPLPPAVLHEVTDTLHAGHAGAARPDLSQALAVSLDGRPLKMLATVVPIPQFLPKRAGAAIVLADVTDFARLDELRGEVVAVASHELKTPLTSLQMNLLLLREQADNLTARQREILTAAVHGGEELAATIEELLDLTRVEAGQLQLAKQRVDVAALVEQVAGTQRPRYQDAGITLRIVKDAAVSTVQGDPARLKVVFMNLLTNALKYTPRGGEVTIRLGGTVLQTVLPSGQNAQAGSRPGLQITVTDTGPGIPADLRGRVFEKFFRVEDHLPGGQKGVRGTGIGLYLCREIIRAHGGTISCEAGDSGRGTRIAISLDVD